MSKRKSLFKITLERTLGFVIFLGMLYVANLLSGQIQSQLFQQTVQFLNSNIMLIIAFSVIFFFGEIFFNLIFPFSLPAPIINAVGAMYLLNFIFNSFTLIETVLEMSIFGIFRSLSFLIYPIVFVAVLVGGYIAIFVRLFKCEEKPKKKPGKKPKKKQEQPTWEEIGQEFRQVLYDVLGNLRDAVKPKKKRK